MMILQTLVKWALKKYYYYTKPKFKVHFVEDIPSTPSKNCMYIVGEDYIYWVIAFLCPCGCGETILLNLLKEARPVWVYSINQYNEVCIDPSVWRKKGCKSHFFIVRNRTKWV